MSRGGMRIIKDSILHRYLPGLLLLLGIILLTGWGVQRFRKAGQSDLIASLAMDMNNMQPRPGSVPVAIAPVERRVLEAEKSYTGSIRPEHEVLISARVDGTLTEIPVYNGSRVVKGQLLARLSAPELEARTEVARKGYAQASQELQLIRKEAQRLELERSASQAEVAREAAELQAAEASLQVWKERLPRELALYQAGAIALESYQQAQAEAQVAESAVKSARAQLEQMQRSSQAQQALLQENQIRQRQLQASLARIRAEIHENSIFEGYTQVKAPFSGLVSERLMAPGSVVPAGTPLLKLISLDPIRVQVPVPEAEQSHFRVGTRMIFSTAAAPDDEIEAPITAVTPQLREGSRTRLIEALLPNPEGSLLPGMYVKARLQLEGEAQPRAVVPLRALHQLGGQDWVWVVRGQRAHRVAVQVLTRSAAYAALEDLDSAHPVIIEGSTGLQEGMAVTPVRWGPHGPEQLPAPGGNNLRLSEQNRWQLQLPLEKELVIQISLSPHPPGTGPVTLRFQLTQAGKPLSAAQLKLETSMPDMNMAGPALTARATAPGRYEASFQGMSGLWQITLSLESGGRRLKPLSFEFNWP